MDSRKIEVERLTFHSSKSFEDVLDGLYKGIGCQDFGGLQKRMASAKSFVEFSEIIQSAVGSSQLMEFMRLDLGAALRIDPQARGYKIVRIIAGNPLIMKQMAEFIPDAGSYAPVTILVYERNGGVHVSYDKMESKLASYDDGGKDTAKALQVAQDLDSKVIRLLTEATAS